MLHLGKGLRMPWGQVFRIRACGVGLKVYNFATGAMNSLSNQVGDSISAL